MVKWHSEGKLIREIAELIGVSNSTVARTLNAQNVKSRHPSLTDEKKNKILELYKEGYNQTQICELLQTSRTTVRTLLRENGISLLSNSKIHQQFEINENYFEYIDTPQKAYILGLIYADGNIHKNMVRLSLQEDDKEILEKIRRELQSTHPIKIIHYNTKNPSWKNQYCLSIVNKKLRDDLVLHGVTEAKSLTLTFPNTLSSDLYNHFIRGYFDGDGYVSKNPKEKRISIIGTEQFCLKIKDISESVLNVHCSISVCHRNESSPTRALGIAGGKQVKKFLDWMYQDADLFIQRKFETYKNIYCS